VGVHFCYSFFCNFLLQCKKSPTRLTVGQARLTGRAGNTAAAEKKLKINE
jgi:hypothetical protein